MTSCKLMVKNDDLYGTTWWRTNTRLKNEGSRRPMNSSSEFTEDQEDGRRGIRVGWFKEFSIVMIFRKRRGTEGESYYEGNRGLEMTSKGLYSLGVNDKGKGVEGKWGVRLRISPMRFSLKRDDLGH